MWSIGGVGGVSVVGFFYLLKVIATIEARVDTAVQMKTDFDKVVKILEEIKEALLGNFDKKGIITRLHDLEDRFNELENTFKKLG
jgi:hypothetical protein